MLNYFYHYIKAVASLNKSWLILRSFSKDLIFLTFLTLAPLKAALNPPWVTFSWTTLKTFQRSLPLSSSLVGSKISSIVSSIRGIPLIGWNSSLSWIGLMNWIPFYYFMWRWHGAAKRRVIAGRRAKIIRRKIPKKLFKRANKPSTPW